MTAPWTIEARWIGRRRFEAHSPTPTVVQLDARAESGGESTGPTPMETLLTALAGCTGMDVVGILEKMRAPLVGLSVRVSGERAPIHPKVFTKIHIRYEFWGPALTAAQVERAVRLSQEKYCSVAAMLRPAVALTYETVLIDAQGRDRQALAG
ncbi:MAG TPA: OsmC family protein [Methylomirabilota bacterium]|nr:OsmC family protein [Methylomirabilota bacterium]